ncbi:tRNA (N6-isopentenyl adenosine(37)-C2)-methylthiotransferase MiaB [bacterium]|nr:tRNA (N6-isopentenyl adenosine(37)-C2)-methylthiotransferase MiaB [bacterium]
MSRKFFIRTFGCQMNSYDSERVATLLIARGWESTDDDSDADLLIVNTCSVREKPLQKVFSTVGRFVPLKQKKDAKVFVMGCVAQQVGADIIKKARVVDAVFGPGQEYLIPEVAESNDFPQVFTEESSLHEKELFPEQSFASPYKTHSAFITVMHGCNNFCSYCIVPFVRGREVSRSSDDIINEIKVLIGQGVREITLLGQNVNSYRDDENKMDFSDLLFLVAEIKQLRRIRFVTSHPKDFNEKLAKTFVDIPKLMPYLHLPAQAGSDEILTQMRRGYSRAEYLKKMALMRSVLPNIGISSDFIVGFPGETLEQFEQTLSLIREVRYDSLFAFVYSPRPGTSAEKLEDVTPAKEKLRRLNLLLDEQKKIMKEARSRFLHSELEVMVDGNSPKSDTLMGRTPHNLIVHFVGDKSLQKGDVVTVKITEILDNTMRGTVCGL